MSRFAETTEVPVEETRAELEALLVRNGATQREDRMGAQTSVDGGMPKLLGSGS
ncbi:MAG TPA: hypothetical protein VFV10_14265 [Gammaproteobacteria bacterium]|nr:hypothetical protein [Gammaproteobacteria bacterium]